MTKGQGTTKSTMLTPLSDLCNGHAYATLCSRVGRTRTPTAATCFLIAVAISGLSLAIITSEQKIVDAGAAAGHSAANALRVADGCGASIRPVHA
jgi:hypothetical protein